LSRAFAPQFLGFRSNASNLLNGKVGVGVPLVLSRSSSTPFIVVLRLFVPNFNPLINLRTAHAAPLSSRCDSAPSVDFFPEKISKVNQREQQLRTSAALYMQLGQPRARGMGGSCFA